MYWHVCAYVWICVHVCGALTSRNLSLMLCMFVWLGLMRNQSRPPTMSEEQLQRLDGFLFHHVKTTIVPRFICLSKVDLRTCITTFVPTKAGGLPPDTTQQQVGHVSAALVDDYYKYDYHHV